MNNPAGMAIVDTVAKLIKEELSLIGAHGSFMLAQVFFEVVVN